MSFGFFTCLWLVSFAVLVDISYGRLPLRSDTIPRTSRDVAASFQRFATYNVVAAAAAATTAADQTRRPRRRKRTSRSYFLPFFKRPSDLEDREKTFFDDDDDNDDDDSWKQNFDFPFDDTFERTKFTPWTYVLPPRSSLPKNDYNNLLLYPDPPLTVDNTKYHPPPPPPIDIPYLRDKFSSRRSFYRPPPPPPPPPPPSSLDDPTRNVDRSELTPFFRNDILSNDRRLVESSDTTDDRMMRSFARVPEFTYYFDDNDNTDDDDDDDDDFEDRYPFAVRPNDPRYYRTGLSPVDTDHPARSAQQIDKSSDLNLLSKIDYDRLFVRDPPTTERFLDLPILNNPDIRNVSDLDRLRDIETEDEHSPRDRPFVFSIARDLNSDIYFIAVIAGCSAAAMFVFVLISLTWCRLQRGAKAAADVEYPAYGVTGPNKDVSPSEDQRLAQSAQMYHFQHQKQQIIAMENRTSANRDPGSLSEAESDEENEEGDYTVYECPGLAATGEMEVKNPLFHDDPTPATPTPTPTLRVDKEEEDRM